MLHMTTEARLVRRRPPAGRRRWLLACSVGSLLSLSAVAASAATATDAAQNTAGGADTSANNSSASQVGGLVVTARRRAESIQKVPIAIVAFSQNTLTSRAIHDTFALSTQTPGLSVTAQSGNSSVPQFNMRGHGQDFQTASGSVETYFADIPLSAPFQTPTFPVQFFDVQSIQVLKGPQGTLFGRNTTGGAVVVVPQAPTNEYGGYVRLQGGDYNDFQFEGALNVPLKPDQILLRLSGFEWQRKGYARTLGGAVDAFGNVLPSQTYNNENVTELRASLLMRLTDQLTNSTVVAVHIDSNRSTQQAIFIQPTGGIYGPPLAALAGIVSLDPYRSDINVNLNKPYENSWIVVNTTTYQITPDLTFKNIFGFVTASGYTDDADDVDGTPLPLIDLQLPARPRHNYQYTDEVQLLGKSFDNHLSWTVGGLIDITRQPTGLDTINVQNNTYQAPNFAVQLAANEYTSYSVYGSATYNIVGPLDVTGGIRSTWDDIKAIFAQTGGATDIQDATPGSLATRAHDFQGLTYNADLEYHLTNQIMLYGGYRHGYKRGGFDTDGPPATSLYQPETDEDYYIGAKTQFNFDGVAGTFNIEAYDDLYRGTQASLLNDLPPPYDLITLISNIPRGIFRGFEADLNVDLTDWFNLQVDYAHENNFWTSWPDISKPPATLDLTVNPVPYSPRDKISITPRAHFNLPSDRGEVAVQLNYTLQGHQIGTYVGNALDLATQSVFGAYNQIGHGADVIPGYGLLNLRLEWNRIMGSKVNGAFNVTNLTNQTALLGNTGLSYLGVDAGSFGPPRMINFELSTKF